MTIDPHWDKVVLALPMTGANNSTTFTDFSLTPKTITRNGDAKISTAQSKWGQGSGLFDGNGDYLSLADSTDFQFGSGDFTIECWVRFSAVPTSGNVMYLFGRWGANRCWTLALYNNAGNMQLNFNCSVDGSTNLGAGGNGFAGALDTWYHIAGIRSGTTTKVYANGVWHGSAGTVSGSLYVGTLPVTIGANSTPSGYLNGYLQDLRITQGVARYTANFTPPAEPMFINKGAISGTVYEKNQAGVYVPGAYPVRVYKRSDGSLVASTTSAVDGTYTVSDLPVYDSQFNLIEYYAVALDTAATWQSPGLKEQVFPS